ncbi:hypothetical protein H0H92_008557 [Tricholoma furcatifolium]|nr:hypothetical protein H0H92_008557 [Tricholoma furcatifolium]
MPASSQPRTPNKRRRDDSPGSSALPPNPFGDAPVRARPSDHLRSACPLCFGGSFPSDRTRSEPDILVCVDACFTQKRNQQARDPPRSHPRSVFIPESVVDDMERYVSARRPVKKPRASKRARTADDEPEDGYEGGLRVPKSVLDDCEASFTAADDRRQKASTQFFDDTALMALVCRHDAVLWLVNMKSAGEKQHYALALLEMLFQHIPCDFKYHQRLYTLDRQILHARTDIHLRLGQWLARRYAHAQAKRAAAELALQQCGQTETFLRDQWAKQVEAQTKPLPKQSKTSGRDAVEELMDLRKGRDILKERVKDLEDAVLAGGPDVVEAELEREEARKALKKHETSMKLKHRMLGVDQRHKLEKLLSNQYYGVLMNARAAKKRLRDRLRMRKFELDRLERSFRKQSNDQKLNEHVASTVKRREPGISALAALYNRLCDNLERFIHERKAPQGARCPQKIKTKGLFALNVDDEIWQDIGLDDDTPQGQPPPWLSDTNVREGIVALLERDRCLEEMNRLKHEELSIRIWFAEEWAVVNAAINERNERQFEILAGDSTYLPT